MAAKMDEVPLIAMSVAKSPKSSNQHLPVCSLTLTRSFMAAKLDEVPLIAMSVARSPKSSDQYLPVCSLTLTFAHEPSDHEG